MKKMLLAAAAATAMISSAAFAAWNFDPATGTGFVGKGDVQLAFGWNNSQLQRNASGIAFTYSAEEEYKYDCTFTVEVGRHKVREDRTQNRGAETSVNATVAFDARTRNQITGFNLTGLGATVSDGDAPVEGGHCVGGQFNDGEISNVQLNSSTGGLYVNYGDSSVALTAPVVI